MTSKLVNYTTEHFLHEDAFVFQIIFWQFFFQEEEIPIIQAPRQGDHKLEEQSGGWFWRLARWTSEQQVTITCPILAVQIYPLKQLKMNRWRSLVISKWRKTSQKVLQVAIEPRWSWESQLRKKVNLQVKYINGESQLMKKVDNETSQKWLTIAIWLSWTNMDCHGHGWLSWMTLMDDFHGWLESESLDDSYWQL